MNPKSNFLAIILAAGKGSRLNIRYPKPLYKINDISIIDHIINSITSIGGIDILTVVGYQKEKIINQIDKQSMYIVQKNPKGTGDAVRRCAEYIQEYENVFIFVGDAPFVNSHLIRELRDQHRNSKSDCSFLYSKFPFSLPYARLIFDSNKKLQYLIESHLASKTELETMEMFTSHYLFSSSSILEKIKDILPDRKTKEYNLTDLINIYINQEFNLNPIFVEDYWRLMGINTLDDAKFLESYENNKK